MASALELRIHCGTHAGAHEPLAGESQLLGAANDCDFVLADPGLLPQHARLSGGAGGPRLQWLDRPGSEAVALVPGALHRVGPVLISVAAADAPWPGAAQVQAALASQPAGGDAVAPEDRALEVQPPAMLPQDAGDVAEGPGPAVPAAVAPAQPSRRRGGGGRLVIALLLLVPIVALLWAVWSVALTQSSGVPVPAAAAGPSPATGQPQARQAAQAVLVSLGLQARAQVAELDGGRLQVRAALLDDEEYEQLAAALSRLSPRPGLAVTTEQDLQALVAEALAREGAELGAALVAQSLGGGRFRLEGALADGAVRDALLARLRQQLPAPVVLDSALTTGEERGMRLLAALRETGIGEVQGRWIDGRLQVEALLAPSDLARWEQALQRIAPRHPGTLFSASTRLRPAEAPQRLPSVLATLPFRLNAVVGGPAAYVVLDGGAKLMVGGSHRGWRLVSIDATMVAFEGQGGRRALVPR